MKKWELFDFLNYWKIDRIKWWPQGIYMSDLSMLYLFILEKYKYDYKSEMNMKYQRVNE